MLEVVVLAIALSMDAFAVSIGLGSSRPRKVKVLALSCALYFGVFQAVMPFVGFLGGKGVLGWIDGYAHWVAFVLLMLIACKMIYESFAEGIEDDLAQITQKVLLILAIATSVDAMAAGFSLALLEVSPFVACAIIGVTTFVFSWVGVFIGVNSGAWLEGKAELLGGVILILIALKVLLF